jgi:glyoxylase-like metal-dependent hydrolase (beta-lactamase superfamily II)
MAKQGIRGTRGQLKEFVKESASSFGIRRWSRQKLRKTRKRRSYWVIGGHERLKLKTERRDKIRKDTLAISDFLGSAKFDSGILRSEPVELKALAAASPGSIAELMKEPKKDSYSRTES